MIRVTTIALLSAALLFNTASAADLASTTSSSVSRVKRLVPQVGLTQPATTYDVRIAEPVPDVLFVLEVRYLSYGGQQESDWFTFATEEVEADLDDSIVWVALHLVAEWRVVEIEPQPIWETVSNHTNYNSAVSAASLWESMGFWTQIITKRISIPTAKTPSTRYLSR